MNKSSEYIPGMCNIGPAERRIRRNMGIGSGIVAVILLLFLLVINAPVMWRLLIFIPAAGAASGLLQNAFHFCAAFGLRGIYNVLHSAGVTDNVELEEYRKKDIRKALQIIVLSVLIGGVATILSILL